MVRHLRARSALSDGHVRQVSPSAYRAYTLDDASFAASLAGAPRAGTAAASARGGVTVRVPAHRRALEPEHASAAMTAMMEGDATEAQIGAFLLGLRTKGETVEEMEAFAAAKRLVRRARPRARAGDRYLRHRWRPRGTFNISTVAALVAAGAGGPVAKHGNRAATSRCGSADLLEELGVNIELDADGVERCLDEAGIGFIVRPAVPPGDGARRARPSRAQGPHGLQLPRAAVEPGATVRPGGRRRRRADAAVDGRGARPPRSSLIASLAGFGLILNVRMRRFTN